MKKLEFSERDLKSQWDDDVGRSFTHQMSSGVDNLIKEQQKTIDAANRSKSLLSQKVGYISHASEINGNKAVR